MLTPWTPWDNQTPWVCFLFWPWLIYCCYINLNFGPKLSLTKGLKNSKLFTGESSDTKYASPAWKKKDTVTIGHFTVVCSVPWPLNRSEAGRDLVLLKTFLLFICKSWYSHANKPVNMIIYIWKTRRFVQNKVAVSLASTQRPGHWAQNCKNNGLFIQIKIHHKCQNRHIILQERFNTVEAVVSQHLGNSKKWS